ncbi:MAG: TonB family protein [Sphingomonas sp.]|uniref:energy transducer TonB n=1 Tax=Sphingomonas sp. TaxID=28214 RepID=UPI0025EC90C7|nr:energy transducer TonB [Sphingomonas sp.]MBQ1498221.1 TonB family protein [Sphingomonas sp.]
MPALFMLGAAAAVLAPAPGASAEKLRAWPAMRHEGAAYAVATDRKNRIISCVPLDPATDATKVKAACATLAARGVPTAITPALAKGSSEEWFPSADYPAASIPEHKSGSVTIVYEIDERGVATDCMVQHSSGIAKLDVAACAAMLKRARFTPASFQGKPVHAAAIATFAYDSE